MKHLEKPSPKPRGLRDLLRPGPRPWFRRPASTDPGERDRERRSVDAEPAVPPEAHEFERLVSLCSRLLSLRDRALTETRVGEDALSVGDDLKAFQHFASGDHYRRRAGELEGVLRRQLEALTSGDDDGAELAAEAMRVARQRRYGSPDVDARPQFV